MPFVPNPVAEGDIFRVVYFQNLASQRMLTVLHCVPFTISAAPYLTWCPGMALALANACIANDGFWGSVRQLLSVNLTFNFVRVQRVYPTTDVYFSSLIDTPGGQEQAAAPPVTALTYTKRTVLPGKEGRGSIHLPGGRNDKAIDGLWDETYNTAVLGEVNHLLGPFSDTVNDNSVQWVVPNLGSTTGSKYEFIQEIIKHPEVRSMHRRTVGLGE